MYTYIIDDMLCGCITDDMCVGARTEPMSGLRGPEFGVGALFEHAYADARLMICYVDALLMTCVWVRERS